MGGNSCDIVGAEIVIDHGQKGQHRLSLLCTRPGLRNPESKCRSGWHSMPHE
jgi:hypothetical protein